MYDAFIDFLNSLYWDGYAEDLLNNSPSLFYYEYEQFSQMYKF